VTRPIDLRSLAASPTRRVELLIDTPIERLESLTPVQGEFVAEHRGDFLEVEGHARTIVTLECDRCLKRFNHRLATGFREVLWLDHAPQALPPDQEVPFDDLEEHLPANGQLDPIDLIYQHLSLALPVRRLCAEECAGFALPGGSTGSGGHTDHRWAALAELRKDLPQ
jgi:uncharacterized protein